MITLVQIIYNSSAGHYGHYVVVRSDCTSTTFSSLDDALQAVASVLVGPDLDVAVQVLYNKKEPHV